MKEMSPSLIDMLRIVDEQMKADEERKKKIGTNRRKDNQGPPQGMEDRRSGKDRRRGARSKDEGDK